MQATPTHTVYPVWVIHIIPSPPPLLMLFYRLGHVKQTLLLVYSCLTLLSLSMALCGHWELGLVPFPPFFAISPPLLPSGPPILMVPWVPSGFHGSSLSLSPLSLFGSGERSEDLRLVIPPVPKFPCESASSFMFLSFSCIFLRPIYIYIYNIMGALLFGYCVSWQCLCGRPLVMYRVPDGTHVPECEFTRCIIAFARCTHVPELVGCICAANVASFSPRVTLFTT